MEKITTRWRNHYENLAKEAANSEDGAFMILGAIEARLDMAALRNDDDQEAIAHIRFLLSEYREAHWK